MNKPYLYLRFHVAWHAAALAREKVKKLQESQSKTQAALKRKMEEHSIAMRKVTHDSSTPTLTFKTSSKSGRHRAHKRTSYLQNPARRCCVSKVFPAGYAKNVALI